MIHAQQEDSQEYRKVKIQRVKEMGNQMEKKTLSKSEKEKFSEAQKLCEAGDFAAELKLRIKLAESNPESSCHRAKLGLVYEELGELEPAEREYRKAVKLDPTWELASLGLFHILWDQDRRDEAFEEMKRFQLISDWASADYREIMKEIKEKWGSDSESKESEKSE